MAANERLPVPGIAEGPSRQFKFSGRGAKKLAKKGKVRLYPGRSKVKNPHKRYKGRM